MKMEKPHRPVVSKKNNCQSSKKKNISINQVHQPTQNSMSVKPGRKKIVDE
jgi:hypothetical protein